MRYGDDQCVQCGAVRVAGSTLCAGCLVGEQKSLLIRSTAYESEIKKLKKKLKKAIALAARLVDHISSEAVYTSELRLELWKAKGIIKGG